MAEKKPSNRERIKEIVTGIEANIQDLFQSDKFADYLRTMSRFHHYSVNNTLLIHMQRPEASMPAAGFNKWKQMGRYVKKGEKGLTIIAPTPLKKKIEEMRLDPDTMAPVLDRDGNIIMVDDDRMRARLLPGEKVEQKSVRFRTLGCYPLTGGVESAADTLEEIVKETLGAVTSERTSRVIDHEAAGSMERRKREGYF